MPPRARLLGAGVVVLALMLAAVAAALVAAPASIAATTCPAPNPAWANQIGAGGVNGYGADLDAGYWITSFLATPGAGITLTGSFPEARYMSISAYNSLDPSYEPHLYDAQIQPDSPLPGQVNLNRFQSGTDPNASGTYTVSIVAQAPPPTPHPNTLYVGQNNALVYVMYRVYDAGTPSDPTGGVGLPSETTTFLGAATGTRSPCVAPPATSSFPPGLGSGITQLPGSNASEPSWTPATVTRLPDADTGYMTAQVTESAGRIVVFRAQMPTFPDTDAGTPPWQQPVDVRYWSICEYEETALVAAGCVADHDAVMSSGGVATFVVSTPQDRPTNATAAAGVNWLPWGDQTLGLVVYRQMLADFPESIDATATAPQLQSPMGSYYPQITYCSVTEFEAAGASGCLSPPPPVVVSSGGGSSSTAPPATSGTTAENASAEGKLSRAAIDRALSPEIAPSGKGARIKALLSARGYTFPKYKLPEAGRLKLSWWSDYGKRHQTLVASGTVALTKQLTGTLHLKLSSAGRKLLARVTRTGITGVANYAPAGASKVTLSRAFTLKR